MQTRTVGLLIATALLVAGQSGCRNLPGGRIGRGPDVRTIAGIGVGPERFAVRDRDGGSSTISSRVDPPDGASRTDAIIGQVIDNEGTPVANARVRLAVNGAPGGREVVGTTNRSGQFLLRGLKPGDDYTVIAEWDDGRDFLLGRSSVSAPSEEVQIRVASVEESGRSAEGSGAGFESSKAASYSRNDRDLAPASLSDDRPESSRIQPERSDQSPSSSSRGHSGWTPSDSVRRASLEPDDRTSWEVDQGEGSLRPPPGPLPSPSSDRPVDRGPVEIGPGQDRTFSERLRTSDRGQSPPRNDPPRELDPDDFPLPISSIEGDRDQPRPAPEAEAPTRNRRVVQQAPPRPAPRATADSVPLVQRFEPTSSRDREDPDSPLLMTDSPPEQDDIQPESRLRNENRSPARPGSIEVAPRHQASIAPNAEPKPLPVDREPEQSPDRSEAVEPDPSFPEPEYPENFEAPDPFDDVSRDPDEPHRSEVRSSEPDLAGNDPFQDVPARVSEPSPEFAGLGSPPAAEPDLSAEEHLAADSSTPIRWADLPPPAPLERVPILQEDREEEEDTPDTDGPLKRARGLFKWVSRDSDTSKGIEPAILVDEERNLLQDFRLPDLNGKPYRLKEKESEYVLLCFWGTWCEPCVAALPRLADLQRQFGPDRLRIVSIAYQRDGEGGPRSLSRINRRLGLNYPVLLAPTDQPCPVAEAMDVQYFPTLVLLDRNGRVVHRETGATNEKLLRLDRAIAAAMDESVMTFTKR